MKRVWNVGILLFNEVEVIGVILNGKRSYKKTT